MPPLFAAEPDTIAALTAAFGAAAPFVAWVTRRLFAKLSELIHKFDGIGAKVAAVEEKLDSVAARVKNVEVELRPNGGKSMRDAINAIEQWSTIIDGILRARFDGDSMATFQCDAAGKCVYASVALADMCGMAPEEFLGNGWLRAIRGSGERQRVWDAWQAAVKLGIPYEDAYTVSARGVRTKVRTYTRAVKDRITGETLCYFGVVTPAAPDSQLGPPPPPPPSTDDDPTDEHAPLTDSPPKG